MLEKAWQKSRPWQREQEKETKLFVPRPAVIAHRRNPFLQLQYQKVVALVKVRITVSSSTRSTLEHLGVLTPYFRIWKAFPKMNFHKFRGTSVKNPRKFREKSAKIKIPETSEHYRSSRPMPLLVPCTCVRCMHRWLDGTLCHAMP